MYLDWRDELLVGVELRVRGRSQHPDPRDDEGSGRGMPLPLAAPIAWWAGQVNLPAAPTVAGRSTGSPVDLRTSPCHQRLLRLKISGGMSGLLCLESFIHTEKCDPINSKEWIQGGHDTNQYIEWIVWDPIKLSEITLLFSLKIHIILPRKGLTSSKSSMDLVDDDYANELFKKDCPIQPLRQDCFRYLICSHLSWSTRSEWSLIFHVSN